MRVNLLCAAMALACSAACGPGPPAPAPASTSPPPATAPASTGAAPASDDDQGHEHTAPHGGTLVELGEEFAHVELVLDAATGALTAYTLDGEAETAVRIPQPSFALWFVVSGSLPSEVTLTGVANPLTGETVTDTSQFRAMVPKLKGVSAFEGSIKAIALRGQAFHDVAFRYPSTGHE